MRLTLPANGWVPRLHQKPFWNYLEHGGRRASVVAHRRWGKDDVLLRRFSIAAFERVGNYWHLLPEKDQARKAIWNAVNPHTSKRRIDEAFPAEIRKRTIDQEMMIEFINGLTYQIGGSDRYDALVGSTPVGIAFSEWALSNPHSWAYLRPILLENDGWAAFITTPRGKNHAWTMHNAAVDDQTWFHLTSPATQTNVFTPEQLAQERTELIREHGKDEGEALYDQEYLCSFEAAIIGSYYVAEFRRLDTEKQIISVPWAPSVPVITAWDIGFGDSTAIWFVQLIGREVHVIDYYEASGADIGHYAKVLKEKPYVFEDALLPHDAGAGELGTGKSISRMLSDLGVRNRVLPRDDVDAGIMQVRQLLPQCWFDAKRCGPGIEALRQYRKQYDEERKVFSRRPLHDWASHSADAFRYLAMGLREEQKKAAPIKYPTLGIA